jgi:transcriptional regulator with XRE-family HTH domain
MMTKIETKRVKNIDTGQDIRDLRTRLGISQEELAHAIGIEQSLVSKIELDRVKSPHTRLRLSKVLSAWPSS